MNDTAKHCRRESRHVELKKGERCPVCNNISAEEFRERFADIFRERLADDGQPRKQP